MDYKLRKDETEELFIYRIYSDKSLGINSLTNEEIGKILNDTFDKDYDESAWRKKYQTFAKMFNGIKDKVVNNEFSELLDEKEEALYKLKVKTSNKIREYRSNLRLEAKLEEMIDAFKENDLNIKVVVKDKPLKKGIEAILLISDWHIGSEFQNVVNKYNVGIATERVGRLISKTISYCKSLNVSTLHIVNLGDMIHGIINTTGRIESDLRVIEQIKTVTKLLFDTCCKLNEHFTVDYRQVIGNHCRISANYKESLKSESFGNLIGSWLKDKLALVDISYIENEISDDICSITINDKLYLGVHGNYDNIKTVISDLSIGLNLNVQGILMGHYHTGKMENTLGRKVYANGSLMGSDSYAYENRYFNEPEQTLLVFSEDIINIPLNLK